MEGMLPLIVVLIAAAVGLFLNPPNWGGSSGDHSVDNIGGPPKTLQEKTERPPLGTRTFHI